MLLVAGANAAAEDINGHTALMHVPRQIAMSLSAPVGSVKAKAAGSNMGTARHSETKHLVDPR